jgi:hypothetical protein
MCSPFGRTLLAFSRQQLASLATAFLYALAVPGKVTLLPGNVSPPTDWL